MRMLSIRLIGFTSLIGFAASQSEPNPFLDKNPPAQQSSLVQISGTETKFIGPTDFLTTITTVTTASGNPVTVTRSLPFSVATITAAAEGQQVGDVSIIISPKLQQSWVEIASKVCPIGLAERGMTKKQPLDCRIQFAQEAASVDLFGPETLGADVLPVATVAKFDPLLDTLVAGGEILVANKGKAALALIAFEMWVLSARKSFPVAIHIPKENIATTAPPTTTTSTTTVSTTTTSACPSRRTGEPPEVVCQDPDRCNGNDQQICQAGEYKGCNCESRAGRRIAEYSDTDGIQQEILAAWEEDGNKPPPAPAPTLPADVGLPTCEPSDKEIDPGVLNQLATGKNGFCAKAVFDPPPPTPRIGGDSMFLNGTDLDPPSELPHWVSFYYLPLSGSQGNQQDCIAAYTFMIKKCQFNTHTFTGTGIQTTKLGQYGLMVRDRDALDCSGPTAVGIDECQPKCGDYGARGCGADNNAPGGLTLHCVCTFKKVVAKPGSE